MKKNLLAITIMLSMSGFNAHAQSSDSKKKALIVYYSLRNGNTRVVAEKIKENVGGDIFRIETTDTYPADYNDLIKAAKQELESGYRPPMKNKVVDFSQYDTIYLGSPNWWNTIAPAVMTFLESYDFNGKTIVPFITHEGSRLGASVTDIKKLAPKATVLKGIAIRGTSVNDAMPDIQRWLKELNIIQ